MALTFRQRTFAAETIVNPSRHSFALAAIYSSNSRKTGRGPWVSRTILVVVLLCTPMFAIDRDRRIDQLYHTSWTAKDGVPGEVQALAQTTDGFLWLGTVTGLFKFDGVRFERYQPPTGQSLPRNNVTALLALPDGGLWVGFWSGGASLLRGGRITNYGGKDGLPPETLRQFAQDRQGAVWAAAVAGGLLRFDGSHWTKIGADWNFHAAAVSVFVDHKGTLWVGTESSVLFLRENMTKFQPTGNRMGYAAQMGESHYSTLWMAETARSVRPVPLPWIDPHVPQPEIKVGSESILFDDRGSLWITTIGDGIRRVPYPERLQGQRIEEFSPSAETFTQRQGLSSDYVECILQDREGNIWIGTNLGLDRFRQSAIVPFAFPAGSSNFTVVAGDDGAVWAGESNRDYFEKIMNGQTVSRLPLLSRSAYRDTNGTIWIGSGDGRLLRLRHNRVDVPAEFQMTPKRLIPAITADSAGRLWISRSGEGVFRSESGGQSSLASLGGPKGAALSALTDSAGRVWFGFPDDIVAVLDRDKVRTLSRKDGILVGNVMTIQGGSPDVWIGGDAGLASFENGRFWPVVQNDGKSFGGVSGIVVSLEGLWFSENRGVIHIPQTEVQLFRLDHGHRMQYRLFDYLDGLPAPLQKSEPLPSVIQATDGRLWFATAQGLAWIDPQRTPTDTLPPPVSIQSVTAGGNNYGPFLPSRLPAHTKTLQIVYTALSLTIPERTRFRIKLEGLDSAWSDFGAGREADYTNLGPGPYSFHVIACNSDGVWNQTGATWNFVIAPSFNQTLWFKALMGVMGASLLWLLYSFRLRQATGQIQARLGERLEERGRIARELHDTLIQSVDGLMLRLQTALDEPDPERSRQMIGKALDSADAVMLEGRQRVSALRAEATTVNELSEALASYGQDLSREQPAAFSVALVGSPKAIDPFVRDEAYCIGREALGNAFQHADATKIEVEVTYDRRVVHMRVRDNGHGIDEQILNGGRPGHWGLRGMRERAQAIGGILIIWSRTGVGTEINLEIPGGLAYDGFRALRPNWMKRLIGGRRVMR